MVNIDLDNEIVEFEGNKEKVISELSAVLADIAMRMATEETKMFRQDQAEAAVYAMAKATKRWLNIIYNKDIDLAQVGRILINHPK